MKATGMTRQVDTLGRIVIPIEIRNHMDIGPRDYMEIYVDNDKIILQKYHPSCVFCDETEDIILFNNKRVCRECLAKLKEQAK